MSYDAVKCIDGSEAWASVAYLGPDYEVEILIGTAL